MSNAQTLVGFFDANMEGIRIKWAEAYREGFQAYLNGEPRVHRTHRYGRNGMWFKGWDAAKETEFAMKEV